MIDSYRLQSDLASQPPSTSGLILLSLHYAYPAVIFLYYMLTTSVAVCTLQTRSSGYKHKRKRVIILLLLFAVSTYLVQIGILVVQSLVFKSVLPSQDTIIGLLSCILVYGVQFTGLAGSEKPVWYPYVGSLWIALLAEPSVEALSLLTRTPISLTYVQFLDIATVAARYLAFLSVLVVYYGLGCSSVPEEGSEAERQSLIPKEDGQRGDYPPTGVQSLDSDGYGSVPAESTAGTQSTDSPEPVWERRRREARERMEKRLEEEGNWLAYARRFMVRLCAVLHPRPSLTCSPVPDLLPLHMACQ